MYPLEHEFFDRLYKGRSFERSKEDQREQFRASRIRPVKRHAAGFEDVYLAQGKLLVTVRSIKAKRTFEDISTGLGRLVLVFHLAGQRETELNDARALSFDDPCLGVYFHAKGVKMRSIWHKGTFEKSVVIGTWPEDLPETVRNQLLDLPQFSALRSGSTDRLALKIPIPIKLKNCIEDIINLRVGKEFIPYFLEAKAQEAFCLATDILVTAFRPPQNTKESHERAILGLLPKIESSLQDVFGVQYFARMSGLSLRNFSRVFKDVTGYTYPEYISRIRLEKSRSLIETTELQLKQIAYLVGYRYTSNLSLSIKKAYGISPRQMRIESSSRKSHISLV